MPPARLPKRRAGDASRSVVHTRLNDPQAGIRNPCINFITAQPQRDGSDAEALDRLNQLAALFKPIMQEYNFKVNSLEEFEPNDEFLGRCWNNGETIELVLRDRRNFNRFVPLSFVARVFCHELAHIAHMNHLSPHTKLTGELCREVRRLQSTGYYGDGFWSAGRTLEGDSVQGMSQLQPDFVLPRETCGGAYRRRAAGKRTAGSRRPTKRRRAAGASLTSGAQTGKTIKPGVGKQRLNRELPGQGGRVDGRDDLPKASAKSASYKDDPNSTFRKHAQSKSARELRAEAAQLRMFGQKQMQSEAAAAAEVEDAFADFDDNFRVRRHEAEQRTPPPEWSETESETESEEVEEGAIVYESQTESDEEEDQLDGEAPHRTQASKVISCNSSQKIAGNGKERQRSAGRGEGSSAAGARQTHGQAVHDSDDDDELEIVGVKRSKNPATETKPAKRVVNGTEMPRTWGDLYRSGNLYSNATVPKPSKFRGDKLPPPPSRPVAGRSAGSAAGQPGGAADAPGSWACLVCSLINAAAARRCDACETSKGSSLLGE